MNFQSDTRKSGCVEMAVCLAILATAASAAAQDTNVNHENKFYVGAALAISHRAGSPRDISDPDQPSDSVRGSAWGFDGTFGYRLAPVLSLAAEVSVPSRFKSLGADLAISLSRDVELVPQIRMHVINRAAFGDGQSNGFLYLSPLVFHGGVGLRFNY
jgi:hypothetical protein